MNKIKFKKARIKNFLSFGNTVQEFYFPDGMNLIQGYNVETEKSNGAGKSSIVEIVPFGLFGKTIKNLPQSKIINWYNRSGCEVKLYLEIDGNNYTFIRGLKPNKFIVKQNDIEIVRPSDVKSFQYQIEEEILGMDFKTFKNLVYFSPNNTLSILGAKKEDKRKFLESLFDLSDYSEMLKITNTKIRTAEERVRDLTGKIENSDRMKAMMVKAVEDIEMPNIRDIRMNINKLTMLMEGLKDISFDDVSIQGFDIVEKDLQTLKDCQATYNNKVTELTTSIHVSQVDIDNTDITTPVEKKNEITTTIETLQTEDSGISIDTISDSMVRLKDSIGDITETVRTNKEVIIALNSRIDVQSYVISSNNTNITTIKGRKDNIDGKDTCDFCGSECDHDKIAAHHYKQIKEFCDSNTDSQEHIATDESKIQALTKENKQLTEQATTLAEELRDFKDQLVRHDTILTEIGNLREQLKLLPDVAGLLFDISEKKVKIEGWQAELRDVQWKFDMNKEDIELHETKVARIKDEKIEYDKHTKRLDETQGKLNSERQRLDDFQKVIDGLEADKKNKEKQIASEDIHRIAWQGDITKLNKMIDHLSYLRVSLKDENVKQFAISSLLPFLNSRANYYLSESGFPYVVYIDGWLDVSIRGMGTEDVGYDSLSGGESKAMDMAIQLGCNDIAELHARTLLGISIYDEILDTSLDADGVLKLMEIVRVKQRDTDNCVFCITHRDEIKELDFDNYTMIEKENGFSTIQTQTAMV